MVSPEYLNQGEVAPEILTNDSKPSLIIKKEDYGVIIKLKASNADSVNIYSKRSSEDNFTLLAQVTSGYCIDSRPNLFGAPELREYMAYYVKNQKQVGQASDVVLIIKK
jgi:hypothetical protein